MTNIDVRLAGGLGNQLFQVAAAIHLSGIFQSSHSAIYIDTRFLTSYKSKRKLEVEFLTKLFPMIKIGQSSSFFSNISSRFRLARIIDGRIGYFELISSIPHLTNIIKSPINNGRYILDGYFQDPNILFNESQRHNIRNHMLLEKNDLIKSIMLGKKYTGIHIRRGDYLSSKANKKIFKLIPFEYYHKALKQVSTGTNILVSSDDDNLSYDSSREIGGVNVSQFKLTLEEEFCLLMSCNDYVIANSTFSWWAAYLGYSQGKTVFSPSSWFVNKVRNQNNPLILPHFKLIDV